MGQPQTNTQTPIYSCLRTELLSLRTKTSKHSLCTVDRLKDLIIGYHHLRRHHSSRSVNVMKRNVHPFIVVSFIALPVMGNDMASKRCGITVLI